MDDRTRARPPLRCTVRDCARGLELRDGAWRCEAGHAFDVARRGYVNLLQPNDRRSRAAGDSAEQVDARLRGLERGLGRAVAAAIVDRARAVPGDAFGLEVGCGPGRLIAELERAGARPWIGVDLSVAAIERAARASRSATWVVANVDHGLPALDRSLATIVSVTGPRHGAEFARALAPGGRALIATPAADDLIELRGVALGDARAIERSDKVIAELAEHLELVERARASDKLVLDSAGVADALAATYRGSRRSVRERIEGVDGLEVTSSHDLLVFAARH